MVSNVQPVKTLGKAVFDLDQHRRVPFIPRGRQLVVDVRVPFLHVGAFERVRDDVEQERVVQDL